MYIYIYIRRQVDGVGGGGVNLSHTHTHTHTLHRRRIVENGRVLMCLKFVNSPPPPWADVYSDASAADGAAVRCSRRPRRRYGRMLLLRRRRRCVWVCTRSSIIIDVAVFGGAVLCVRVCLCAWGKRGFFRRKILSVYAAAPPER